MSDSRSNCRHDARLPKYEEGLTFAEQVKRLREDGHFRAEREVQLARESERRRMEDVVDRVL